MPYGTRVQAATNLTNDQIDRAIAASRSVVGPIVNGGVTLNGQAVYCELEYEATITYLGRLAIFSAVPDLGDSEPWTFFGFCQDLRDTTWRPLSAALQSPTGILRSNQSWDTEIWLVQELVQMHLEERKQNARAAEQALRAADDDLRQAITESMTPSHIEAMLTRVKQRAAANRQPPTTDPK